MRVSMTQATKKRPGRPKLTITNAMCDEAERLPGRGLTMQQIAGCLGISERTLYTHQAENSQLQQSIKKGRAEGLAEISNALFEAAKAGNVTAQIFFLKNRDPENWRDSQYIHEQRARDQRSVREMSMDELKDEIVQTLSEKSTPEVVAFFEREYAERQKRRPLRAVPGLPDAQSNH